MMSDYAVLTGSPFAFHADREHYRVRRDRGPYTGKPDRPVPPDPLFSDADRAVLARRRANLGPAVRVAGSRVLVEGGGR